MEEFEQRVGSTDLTPGEIARYSRHLLLPEVGLRGQRRLKAARVLCVGAGGLGSPVSMYLAAAGVGTLGLVDFDVVDASNLQRQILHGTEDVGKPKLDSAKRRLHSINPDVGLELHPLRLARDNALDLVRSYDLVVDGTDNFPTRYLVNDACVLTGRPFVYGSIFRWEGQVAVFNHGADSPNYRCLFPEPPPPGLVPNCAEGGVFGVLPGVVGTLQATEVVKLITGVGEPLSGKLLLFDALSMTFRTIRLKKSPDNPLNGAHPTITELVDYEAFCGIDQDEPVPSTSVEALRDARAAGDAPFVLDVRKEHEAEIADLGADQRIPVGELETRLDELRASRDAVVVVHCKAGGRSARAVRMLRAAGYDRAVNLEGGVLAWGERIDPDVPRY